jgi:GxxExxY protein
MYPKSFWVRAKEYQKRQRKEFIDYIGEETENTLLHEEEEYYSTIRDTVDTVYSAVGPNKYEKEYREEMAKKLQEKGMKVKEEVTEVIGKDEKGYTRYVRLDICDKENGERIIFELKKSSIKGAVDQLVNYLNKLSCTIGFLVSYRSKDFELYMFLREDEYYIVYDGEKVYKYYIINLQ